MQSLLKNKLIIFSLIFLILITNLSNVFASDLSISDWSIIDSGWSGVLNYNSNVVEYIRNCPYYHDTNYLIFGCQSNNLNNHYYVFIIKQVEDLKISFKSACLFTSNKATDIFWYEFDAEGNYLDKINAGNFIFDSDTLFAKKCVEDVMFLSNGIFYNGYDDTVFFPVAPQGITETLVEEMEKIQVADQLKTMIAGFLKYLIVLVISLIAFWKGWKFLSMQLKRA